jgi:hypothetical protein
VGESKALKEFRELSPDVTDEALKARAEAYEKLSPTDRARYHIDRSEVQEAVQALVEAAEGKSKA